MTQIPQKDLIEGRWYVGRGRNANVARWSRINGRVTFLTIGFTFDTPNVKDEGYWKDEQVLGQTTNPATGMDKKMIAYGCFQPFLMIAEGDVTKPIGNTPGWDSHYALEMSFWPDDTEHRTCTKCGQDFQIVRKAIVNVCPSCDEP